MSLAVLAGLDDKILGEPEKCVRFVCADEPGHAY